jgi:hypothetical protein
MTVATAVGEQVDVDAIDAELVELYERMTQARARGHDGDVAWTWLLIDEALERRHAATEASIF